MKLDTFKDVLKHDQVPVFLETRFRRYLVESSRITALRKIASVMKLIDTLGLTPTEVYGRVYQSGEVFVENNVLQVK